MFTNPAMDLVVISALFAVISQTVQLVMGNRKETRRIQKNMKEKNAELKELMKKGESAKNEVERVQREMMELSTSTMKNMPKLMIVNMIVFLPLFGLVSHAYNGTKIELFYPLNMVWAQGDWFWFYVLCSFLISMVVNHVLNTYDNHLEKKQTMTVKQ
ncbi:MAG: DUF106 domain-containing protein [Candidatus Diapherotrites archaeon]|uniref:DUF106 domain-containing protein n=1 Tax=Candidatus Iainarchaeum sp. TaxID=3101447 RepID=A0A8T4C9H4_9ARCH|nr:DUF106 domain-containing protein [Candidatus Diapherotrites archaeon]